MAQFSKGNYHAMDQISKHTKPSSGYSHIELITQVFTKRSRSSWWTRLVPKRWDSASFLQIKAKLALVLTFSWVKFAKWGWKMVEEIAFKIWGESV